jgi:hypothetical protein
MRIERIGLEHHGNAAFGWCEVVHNLSIKFHCAGRNIFETGDQAQQGGLAATRRSNKHHEFTLLDVEINAFDDIDRTERLFDIFK